ncbi:MAG: hypothetical protein PHD07_06145 [Bacteroidales bacterium]|nr:hypothetical protein [Bacteroidales bacterium]MDD3201281.1 hypothetical protein [Bacteroidales bacterium]
MAQSSVAEVSAIRNSYLQKEQRCEFIFAEGGPYWHLCTPGQLTEILFINDEDFKFGVTNTAICASQFNIRIFTDVIMNNHIHTIIEGEREECLLYFAKFKKKLKRYFSSKGIIVDLSGFNCNLYPILSLQAMRNEIVYVNRNGYLVNDNYLPFTYPWGSGNLYFNDFAQRRRGVTFKGMPYAQKRALCHSRIPSLSDNYLADDGMILPLSYCNYIGGQDYFRDAHHYFKLVTKNVESNGEIAKRLGDNIFLTDNEMYAIVYQLSLKQFQVKQPSLLPAGAKIEVARKMSLEYNASNSQIRRILKMDREFVDELFPIKSKR